MAESRREPEGPPADSEGVLHSWKEIAAHLRRDVRTVQRWEKSEGLPVHRHWHHRLGSVYAYKAELDAWWLSHHTQLENAGNGETLLPELPDSAPASMAEPPEESRVRSRSATVGVGTVLIAALVFAGWLLTRNQPETPRVAAAIQPLGAGRVFAKATRDGGSLRIIPVPAAPRLMELAPDGKELYVSHEDSDMLSVVDLRKESVVQRIKLSGSNPSAIVISGDGARAYVGLYDGELDVIDLGSKQVTRVMVGGAVTDLALTADGARLYMAMQHAGLKRLDTATMRITRLPSVACPQRLTLTPDQKSLYVNYQCGGPQGRPGHDSIEIFDVPTERSIATITELPNVGGLIRVSPDGAYVWADGGDACSHLRYDHKGCPVVPGAVLHVIRTADHRVVQRIGAPFDEGSGGFAFSLDGSRLIWGGAETRVLNTVNFAVVEKLPLSSAFAVVAPDGRRVFLSLPDRNGIGVLDVAADQCAPAVTPRAWWPADGSAHDVLGGESGKILHGASFSPGRHGQAFGFDGYASAVELGPADHADQFTVSLWAMFQEPAQSETSVIEKTPPAGTNAEGWSLLRTANGALRLCRNSGVSKGCLADAWLDSGPVPHSAWHHITIVKDKEQWALYVNGELTGGGALGEFKHRFNGPLRLGDTVGRRGCLACWMKRSSSTGRSRPQMFEPFMSPPGARQTSREPTAGGRAGRMSSAPTCRTSSSACRSRSRG